MKKIFALLLAILCAFSAFSACGSTSDKGSVSKNSAVKAFEKALKNDEYIDAAEKYNTDIHGNAMLEAEAADVITSYMNDIKDNILDGSINESEAKVKVKTIDNVYSAITCPVENYSDNKALIQEALDSKVAYKSGISLFKSGNYADAIEEFSKVAAKDKDYSDAMENLTNAKDKFKKETLDNVDKLITENDYSKAISKLDDAIKVLPDDSDLIAAQNTCQKNHIAFIIESSETAFKDYTCYEEALSIIQAGIQQYPDDAGLIEKRDYYDSFTPINLYDMDSFKGEASTQSNDSDLYSTEHNKAFWNGYGSFAIYSGTTDISFNLEGKYNTFTATLYGRSSKNDFSEHSVRIYGDNKILYEKTNARSDAKAFNVSLNITGIEELRIVLDYEGGGITTGIGMCDMLIQKTAK